MKEILLSEFTAYVPQVLPTSYSPIHREFNNGH